MGLGKGLKGFRVFAVALLVAAPSVAYAHAHLTNPPSRAGTNDATIKIPQCGNLPRGTSFVQLDAGATVNVQFDETIGHVGCYQIRLGDKNDSNWQLLKQINDPGGSQGSQTTQVTLPPGFTCETCTLQLLQHMRDNAAVKTCDPDASPTAAGTSVYYSCADIRIGDFPDAAPSTDSGAPSDDDGGENSSSSGGSTTTTTDGGGKTSSSSGDNGATGSRNLRSGAGDDGCNVGFGATSGLSFLVTAGIAATALLRRRRKSG